MILVKHKADLLKHLDHTRSSGCSVGFVPTMGALHSGHISLIEQSRIYNDFTVCSIFVNPTQFDNPADLLKYPVTLEDDINKLEKSGCDLLFFPGNEEMYLPDEIPVQYDLGYLENILEGKYRPGHFQGVCRIVDKLLTAVMPDSMYLGRKDYQQCLVIKKMMVLKGYETKLQICETIREEDGLAMSSRNLRLKPAERQTAVKIIESLMMIKKCMQPGDLSEIKTKASAFLESFGYKVDYTEIADAETLEIQHTWDGKKKTVAVAAAYLNGIRLIDNILLQVQDENE